MRRLLLVLGVAGGLAGLAWLVFLTHPAPQIGVPAAAARARPQGDGYTFAAPAPHTLNPFTADSAVARRSVLRYVTDSLFDRDPRDGALRPALALAVTTEPDRRTHLIQLRDGCKFSDGTPITVADLLFTAEVAQDPAVVLGGGAMPLRGIERAEALGASRLRVRLARSDFAALPELLTSWFVVSRGWFLREIDVRARAAGQPPPAGPGAPGFAALLAQIDRPGPASGPYEPATGGEWRGASELTLVRNERSWRRTAQPDCWNLDFLRLRFLVDPAAQLGALRDGGLDVMVCGDPGALLAANPELAGRYRALRYDYEALGHYMVVWNTRRAALADPRVRRALGALFDRDAIAAALAGQPRPAHGWFKPGSAAYPPPRPPLPLDEARALLAAAGVAPPLRVELTLVAGAPEHRQIFALARDRAPRAGVELRDRAVDSTAFERLLRERDFDAILVLWYHTPWIDPIDEFHSREADGGRNLSGIRDPALDRMLERAREDPDPALRAKLWLQFQERLAELEPVTLLVHPLVSCLFATRFADAEPGPLGLVPERWYVPAGTR